ncbi:MAG: hypothetical protein ACO1PW_00890, partial [Actinomycetota bacterium]
MSAVTSVLGFARPDRVHPDPERPGLHRSPTIEPAPLDATSLAMHACEIRDLATSGIPEPRLDDAGFAIADLPDRHGLHAALRTVRDEQQLSDRSAADIRRSLGRARLRLRDGSQLLLVHVAAEGLLFRREGPAGLDVHHGAEGETPH